MKTIICLLMMLFGASSCTPPPPPPSGGTQTGLHVVWGDSLLWQATGYGSQPDFIHPDGHHMHVRPGKGVSELKDEIIAYLRETPKVTTLALGTNDAGTWDGKDGWTVWDEAAWTEVLANKGATKIIIVLPWIQVGNVATQADVDNVSAARSWLSQRPGVTIVDWRDYVSTGVLDQGGIHVTSGFEGVRYQATVAGDPL